MADYVPPLDDPDAEAYVDFDPTISQDGSIPPAAVFNMLMQEVRNALIARGIDPSATDYTQLAQAISAPASATTSGLMTSADAVKLAAARTALTANLTVHVATTGSDTADGSAATPWRTIQHAVDVVAGAIDLAGFGVEVQLADGIYNEEISLPPVWGYRGTPGVAGPDLAAPTIRGNVSNPAAVVVSGVGLGLYGIAALVEDNALWRLRDLSLQGDLHDALAAGGGGLKLTNIRLLACSSSLIAARRAGRVVISGGISSEGGAESAISTQEGGVVLAPAEEQTWTVVGDPTFSTAFATAHGGDIWLPGLTVAGSAHGPRYHLIGGARAYVGGGGESVFPGDAAGYKDSTSSYT